ncbi:hypothetical protein ACFY8B_03075 [Streptomyces sp. NPDC012751]|uniref:hypothetical protein n=1 Tax=Streptomyces sp. NPDC012751 TaxID=3364846 RepID=UPI0036D1D669
MCSTHAYAAVVIVPRGPRGGRYGPVYGRSVMPGWKRKVGKTPVSTSTSRLYSATPSRNDQWSGNALRRNSLPAEATGNRWSSAVTHRSPRPSPRAGRRSRETATARSPSTRCRVRHSRCSLEPGTTPRTPPARNGPADGTPELITVRRHPDRLAVPHPLVFCVLGNGDPNRLAWQRRVASGDPLIPPSAEVPALPYAEWARLAGLPAVRCDRPRHVASVWADVPAGRGPVLLEFVVDGEVPPDWSACVGAAGGAGTSRPATLPAPLAQTAAGTRLTRPHTCRNTGIPRSAESDRPLCPGP